MKYVAMIAATLSLSACMMEGGNASVARMDTYSASCPGSQHMQTAFGLPMRCGPQAASPYTYK